MAFYNKIHRIALRLEKLMIAYLYQSYTNLRIAYSNEAFWDNRIASSEIMI